MRIHVKEVEEINICNEVYDLFVVSIGYEERASFIARNVATRAKKKLAVGFMAQREIDYESNKNYFVENGFSLKECEDGDYFERMVEILNDSVKVEESRYSVLVDISSMTRLRIAAWFNIAIKFCQSTLIEITFIYSYGEYSPPGANAAQINILEPVNTLFSGWNDPSQTTGLVMGLGYEESRALGVAEYVEPKDIFLFMPDNHGKRYEEGMKKANKVLFEIIPATKCFRYDTRNIHECYRKLGSVVRGITGKEAAMLVPMGPKIFSVVCFVVALELWPHVCVWRVSSGMREKAVQRKGTSKIVALKVGMLGDLDTSE